MIRASSGDRVTLRSSEQLAAGGEGVVYLLPELPDLVAKMYHSPAPGIDVKLSLMIDNPPRIPPEEEGRVSIAWPEDTLLDPATGEVAGFLMRRVSGSPIIEYFNPLRRPRTAPHFTYEHLLVAARNLAEAVGIFHGQRSVIGDLNESNVLVTEDASVALIDTDSFQVLDRRSGQIYRSPVGKPEYTPAELQGHRFDAIDRNSDHDLFGLAVIIYQLLMEGGHPFLGRYTRRGDPPQLENRIAEGHFPHSRRRSVPFAPAPTSPPWDSLHPQTSIRISPEFRQRTRLSPHASHGARVGAGNRRNHRVLDHLRKERASQVLQPPRDLSLVPSFRQNARTRFIPSPVGFRPSRPAFVHAAKFRASGVRSDAAARPAPSGARHRHYSASDPPSDASAYSTTGALASAYSGPESSASSYSISITGSESGASVQPT